MYKFYFWQHQPNIHEAGYIKAIAEAYDCTVIYEREIHNTRKSIGLELPDYGKAKIIHCPAGENLPKQCIENQGIKDIHFFCGIRAFNLTKAAFLSLKESKAKLYLISEARRFNDYLAPIRWIDSIINELTIRKRINGVFAMGHLGYKWFKRTGWDKRKIFPFMYVLNKHAENNSIESQANIEKDSRYKVCYVGQLIKRKSVDTLINAFKGLNEDEYELHIIGSGAEKNNLIKISKGSIGCKNIYFHDPVPNSKIHGLLSQMNLLVLPSRWDGWGAVVNEALSVGTQVLVSDYCGASTIACGIAGETFTTGNHIQLTQKIQRFKNNSLIKPNLRSEVIRYYSKLSPDNFFKYIEAIVQLNPNNETKPLAPWNF